MQRETFLRQIDAAVRAGDIRRASSLAEDAITAGIEHPGVLNLAAHASMERDDFDGAIALLTKARMLAPSDVHAANTLGIAFKRAGRFDPAIAAFDAAIAADPAYANAHFNKGTVLEAQNDPEGARAAYESAVAIDPEFSDALGRLSYLAAMRSDYEEARALGDRAIAGRPQEPPAALRLAEFALGRGDGAAARALIGGMLAKHPDDSAARLGMAKAEIAGGEYAGARQHLEALLATPNFGELHALARNLLGSIEEKEGNFPAAFAAFAEAKATQDRDYARAHRTSTGTAYADRVTRTLAYFKNNSVSSFAARAPDASAGAGAPAQHVFLVGFPRSGTTLLEKTLAGHPSIVTMEEEETLSDAVREFITATGGLDRLGSAGDEVLAPYRDRYWRDCRAAVPALGGKVFIDKMPLYTIYLPLVARLFPVAKIIFALRDPRDVVLSCLKQPFQISAAMYEFCTLERAARLYDLVMQLREIYRERLGLAWLDTRYEDLVRDFDGTVRRIFGFLGVEWDEAVRDVAASTRARVSTTPSGAQVARGLYDGSGQWRRYKDEMAPVLPILAPWVETFGYPKA